MRKTKRQISFLIVAFLSLLLLPYFWKHQLSASSASIDFSYEQDGNKIVLEINSATPIYTSGFTIKLNYNHEAFNYLDTEFGDYGFANTNADISPENILILSASGGQISSGENQLLKVNLEAKKPGAASIMLTDSEFYDDYGETLPASRLKYYTISIEEVFGDSTNPEPDQEEYADPSTNPGDLDSPDEANQSSKSSEDNTASNSAPEESSSSSKSSNSSKDSNSKESEETHSSANKMSTIEPDDGEESKREYNKFLFTIVILIFVIIIIITSIILIIKSFKKKR